MVVLWSTTAGAMQFRYNSELRMVLYEEAVLEFLAAAPWPVGGCAGAGGCSFADGCGAPVAALRWWRSGWCCAGGGPRNPNAMDMGYAAELGAHCCCCCCQDACGCMCM